MLSLPLTRRPKWSRHGTGGPRAGGVKHDVLQGQGAMGAIALLHLVFTVHVLLPTDKTVIDSVLSQVNTMKVQDFALLLPY